MNLFGLKVAPYGYENMCESNHFSKVALISTILVWLHIF